MGCLGPVGHSAVVFLDALASLDFKLSVSECVIHLFSASASTGLSELFLEICLSDMGPIILGFVTKPPCKKRRDQRKSC